jgi:hypothetical protein
VYSSITVQNGLKTVTLSDAGTRLGATEHRAVASAAQKHRKTTALARELEQRIRPRHWQFSGRATKGSAEPKSEARRIRPEYHDCARDHHDDSDLTAPARTQIGDSLDVTGRP